MNKLKKTIIAGASAFVLSVTYQSATPQNAAKAQSGNARFEQLVKKADDLFDTQQYQKAAKAYEQAAEYGAEKSGLPIDQFLDLADSAIESMTLAKLRKKRLASASRFFRIMDSHYPDSEQSVEYFIRVRKMADSNCDDGAALKLSTRIEDKIANVRTKDQVGYWNIVWRELLFRLSVFNPQISVNSFNKANTIYAESQNFNVDPRNKIYGDYHRTLFRDTLSNYFKGPRNQQLLRAFDRILSWDIAKEYRTLVETDWGPRLEVTHPETLSTVKYYAYQRLAELAIRKQDQETGRAYINAAASVGAPASVVNTPLFGAAPRYGEGSQIEGIEAKGSARLEIDQFGRVVNEPEIIDFNGNDIAERAWIDAIKRMTFAPGFEEGAPSPRAISNFKFSDLGLEECYLEVNKRGNLRTVWVSLVDSE